MDNTLRYKLSQYWRSVQEELIPQLTDELGPLTSALLAVVRTLEYARIEEFVDRRWCGIGRPPKDRLALARAFVAKSVLRLPTTEALREHALFLRVCREFFVKRLELRKIPQNTWLLYGKFIF